MLPDESEEIWRYSRISSLDLEAFAPVLEPADRIDDPPPHLRPVLEAVGAPAATVVVDHGRLVHHRVRPDLAERGLAVLDLAGAEGGSGGEEHLGAVARSATDAFTELNTAFAPAPVVVAVPPRLAVEDPIVILHWMGRAGSAAFPRTVVEVGAGAEATVVEHLSSPPAASLSCPVVELAVGAAGRLRYVNVQDLGPAAWHLGYHASRVERDGHLEATVVALGGDYARVRTDSSLTGKGATSRLSAVYFADGHRMHDFRTLQDHAAPSTTSDLLFKGAVGDQARSVYSGLIRVGKNAPGTNAFQTNRNLVLSEGAGAESVPNLEIENNDVRCSHASAVGPIDEEHLYYLESRGVPPEAARRLVVLGFFDDVLGRLPVAELVRSVRADITRRLRGIDGALDHALDGGAGEAAPLGRGR